MMYARQLFEYTKPKLNNNELIWLDIKIICGKILNFLKGDKIVFLQLTT